MILYFFIQLIYTYWLFYLGFYCQEYSSDIIKNPLLLLYVTGELINRCSNILNMNEFLLYCGKFNKPVIFTRARAL